MTVVRLMMQRRISDLDGQGHVNNVNYSEFIQEARVNLKNALMKERAASFGQVVAKMEINYKVSLLHGSELVPIDAWVSRIGTKSYDINYVLYDEQGRVSLEAKSTMVATSGGASCEIAEDVRAILEAALEQPAS
ncbi:MAG: acyl-CoA thioesterase [Actinomycetota bacterium]|nr:acyl-CoA thioesterase [Actinomycetota bacterium]